MRIEKLLLLLSVSCLLGSFSSAWAQDDADAGDGTGTNLSCDVNTIFDGTGPQTIVGQKIEGSPGNIAVCLAEGNCYADLTVNENAIGHGDPGNGKRNYGFCSLNPANSRFVANVDQANRNCALNLQEAGARIQGDIQDAGLEVTTPLYVAATDLVNQSGFYDNPSASLYKRNPDGSAREDGDPLLFYQLYKQALEQGNDPLEAIIQARTNMAFLPESVTGFPVREDDCGTYKVAAGYCSRIDRLGCQDGDVTGRDCFESDQRRRVYAMNDYLGKIGCSTLTGTARGGAGSSPVIEPDEDLITFMQCYSCELIKIVMRTAGTLGERFFDALNSGLKDLVIIVATVLILYNIAKMLLPFGPMEQGRQMMNRILALIGVTSIVVILLSMNESLYWRYVYWPVLDGTMKASQTILTASGGITSIEGFSAGQITSPNPTPEEINNAMAEQMESTVRGINEALTKGASIGWAMIAGMKNHQFTGWLDGVGSFLRSLLLLVSGGILMAVSFYASFVFLYVVIDVALRWTFMSVMMPFAIAAYAFPQTRGFVSFLVRGLMESAVALILVTAVAGLSVQMIDQVRIDPTTYDANGTPSGTGENSEFRITSSAEDLQQYLKDIRDGLVLSPTLNTTAFWHMTTMFMIVGGLMFKMGGVASYLVGSATSMGATDTAGVLTGAAAGAAMAPVKGGQQIVQAVDNMVKTQELEELKAAAAEKDQEDEEDEEDEETEESSDGNSGASG